MSEFDTWYADYEKNRETKGWMPLEKHVVTKMQESWAAALEWQSTQQPFEDMPASREKAALDGLMR